MPDARIIEVKGEDAGIIVGDADGFQFYAATREFYALEGILFRSSREAEAAAKSISDRHAPRVDVLQPFRISR